MLKILLSPFAVGVASRIVAQISAFALIMVASRSLGLAEFGSYAIASALSVIFTTLVYTGVYHLLLRTKDLEGDRDTLFGLQFAIGFAGAAIMAGIGLVLGNLSDRGTGFALLTLAPIPALAALSAWFEAQLIRQGRIRTTAISVLFSELVSLSTAVGMFRVGFGIEALILSRFSSMGFILLVYSSLVRLAPRPRMRWDCMCSALREAWPLWGSVSLGMFSNYGADLFLGAFLNPAAVGAYRAGSRVANTAADVIIQPMGTISWARFSKLEVSSSLSEIRESWKQNVALCFALITPAMISVSLLAPELVASLLDPSWANAASVISILALARIADSFIFLLEPTLTCLGRGRQQFYVRCGDALLLIVLLLTMGWQSPENAAFAVLLKTGVTLSIAVTLMTRATKISVTEIFEIILPGLGMSALCLSVILLVGALPLGTGPTVLILVTLCAEVVIWTLCFTGLLRSRLLVMPTI